MNKGKEKCDLLKSIRKEIATRYGIFYPTNECSFQGECKGTCPKCEQETKYLERELKKKGLLKKSLMMAFALPMTLAAQEPSQQSCSDSSRTNYQAHELLDEVVVLSNLPDTVPLDGTAPVYMDWENTKKDTKEIKKAKRKARKAEKKFLKDFNRKFLKDRNRKRKDLKKSKSQK